MLGALFFVFSFASLKKAKHVKNVKTGAGNIKNNTERPNVENGENGAKNIKKRSDRMLKT